VTNSNNQQQHNKSNAGKNFHKNSEVQTSSSPSKQSQRKIEVNKQQRFRKSNAKDGI